MQDPDDTIHEMQEEINEHEQRQIQLQAEIDRLTAQNLQLRLIADRAVMMLVGSNQFDQSLLTEATGPTVATYLDSVTYSDDVENFVGPTDAVATGIVKPLLAIIQQSPVETNLLELAMAEQNRKKLVDEEFEQLRELAKIKTDAAEDCLLAVNTLEFARRAGEMRKESLVDQYSPSVIISRYPKQFPKPIS